LIVQATSSARAATSAVKGAQITYGTVYSMLSGQCDWPHQYYSDDQITNMRNLPYVKASGNGYMIPLPSYSKGIVSASCVWRHRLCVLQVSCEQRLCSLQQCTTWWMGQQLAVMVKSIFFNGDV
jgi:hypothetical protein